MSLEHPLKYQPDHEKMGQKNPKKPPTSVLTRISVSGLQRRIFGLFTQSPFEVFDYFALCFILLRQSCLIVVYPLLFFVVVVVLHNFPIYLEKKQTPDIFSLYIFIILTLIFIIYLASESQKYKSVLRKFDN